MCEARTEATRAELRQTLRHVMSTSRLPPMAVMTLAASVVGEIYKEVSEAHVGLGACTCGWRPHREADLEAMLSALAETVQEHSARDLRNLQVVGRA